MSLLHCSPQQVESRPENRSLKPLESAVKHPAKRFPAKPPKDLLLRALEATYAPKEEISTGRIARTLPGNLPDQLPVLLTSKLILKIVSETFEIPETDILRKCREENVLYARSAAAWQIQESFGHSFRHIGRFLHRDGEMIRDAICRAQRLFDTNDGFYLKIQHIRARIRAIQQDEQKRATSKLSRISQTYQRDLFDLILQSISSIFHVSEAKILRSRNAKPVAIARQAFTHLALALTHCSQEELAEILGLNADTVRKLQEKAQSSLRNSGFSRRIAASHRKIRQLAERVGVASVEKITCHEMRNQMLNTLERELLPIILANVAKIFHVSQEDILRHTKHGGAHVMAPRAALTLLIRENTGFTLPKIGQYLGNRSSRAADRCMALAHELCKTDIQFYSRIRSLRNGIDRHKTKLLRAIAANTRLT